MGELLPAIAAHLEFFGYTAKLEDGVLKASHPERPYFWVIPVGQGALFRTLFKTGAAAVANPLEFSAFVNRANSYSIVSRFVAKEGFLSVEAWFPNCYEKKAFESFLSRYFADLAAPVTNDSAAVRIFFPPEVPGLQH